MNWRGSWRQVGTVLTILLNSAILLLVALAVVALIRHGRPGSPRELASDVFEVVKQLWDVVSHSVSFAVRWCIKRAVWLGDLATWVTGFFTFAAFYLARRIFLQGRERDKRAQADQVAVWAHEDIWHAKKVQTADGLWARHNLHASYTVYLANHSSSPIMGPRVSIRPLYQEEAKQANQYGKWYFENNVKTWLKDAWEAPNHDEYRDRIGPWVFPPGAVHPLPIHLHVDLDFCKARILFWDSHGAKWSKDIRTGQLEPLNEPLGLVDGDVPTRHNERFADDAYYPTDVEDVEVATASTPKASTNSANDSGAWFRYWLPFLLWYLIRRTRSKRP